MAASPGLKIFNPAGEYIAACFHIEDAACLVAFNGEGSTIRNGHAKRDSVWTEGVDGHAADSYDAVVTKVNARIEATKAAWRARIDANIAAHARSLQCPDCGKFGERKGHHDCQYPQN